MTGIRREHIYTYTFYILINILKRYIKTSKEPDIMLTKTRKKVFETA